MTEEMVVRRQVVVKGTPEHAFAERQAQREMPQNIARLKQYIETR